MSGDRTKDFETNVRRYARLGIPEYFIFDRGNMRLTGWRLPERDARVYVPVVPQAGRFPSAVLELDLALEASRVRFYFGTAPLAEAEELIQRLERAVDEVSHRAQQEAIRAEQEAIRANELERRLAAAIAELEKLRSR
ncbi:MAG: hypothetical protein K0S65_6621 [Labilithrix sp.]|nr:hypothetical protein [Labilithrix sp.]